MDNVVNKEIRRTQKQVIQLRLSSVVKFLLSGMNANDIYNIVNNPADEKYNWKIKKASVYKYINRAKIFVSKHAEIEREYELGMAVSRLNDLYQKCYRIQDFKTCLAIQKELQTLLGLHDLSNYKDLITDVKRIAFQNKDKFLERAKEILIEQTN